MKKKTYLFLTLIMALMTFSACSDDDDEAVGTQNPEQEVAGTYIGTWNQKLTTHLASCKMKTKLQEQ